MGIKGKLAIGFSLLLVIIVGITFLGIRGIQQTNQKHDYVQHYLLYRNANLNALYIEILYTRRLSSLIVLHAGDIEALVSSGIEHESTIIRTRIRRLIDNITQNVRNDPRLHSETARFFEEMMHDLDWRIQRYFFEILESLYELTMNDYGNELLLFDLMAREVELYYWINSVIYALIESTGWDIMEFNDQIFFATNNATIIMILVSSLGIIIGVIVAVFISVTVTKAVKNKQQ